jgi:hypothetical protein
MLAGCCLKSTGVKTEVRQLSSPVSVIFLSSFILHSSFLFPPFTCRNVFLVFVFLPFVLSFRPFRTILFHGLVFPSAFLLSFS